MALLYMLTNASQSTTEVTLFVYEVLVTNSHLLMRSLLTRSTVQDVGWCKGGCLALP